MKLIIFLIYYTCIPLVKYNAISQTLSQIHSKAKYYRSVGNTELTQHFATILKNKSLIEGNEIYKAKSYYLLGECNLKLSHNDSAFFYFRTANKIFEDNGIFAYKLPIKANIALTYYYSCDYFTAEKLYVELLSQSIISQNDFYQYSALLYLGIIASDLGDYKTAIRYTKKALNRSNNLKSDLYCYETCQNNIGYNLFKQGKFKTALKSYLNAIKFLTAQKNPELYSLLLDNIANAEQKINRNVDVSNFYLKASQVRMLNGIAQGSDFNMMNYSRLLYDHKDFIKAKNCGLKAYNIAKSFNSPADQLAMLKNLVIIDSIHASSYASQYIRISDSLQLAERRNRNKFARIAFETDEIIQEKDNAIRQKKIAIATGSGLLLCSVLFLIIRIQRSRQKELIHIQQQQRSDQAIYDLVHNQQSQIDEARQHEKTRIARELHDGVMNRLSSTRLNLYVLNSQRDDATIDKCVRLIDDLQNVEKELRQVAHELSDDIFSGNKSFNVLLQALIDENRPLTEAQIHVEIDERINWELCEGAIKINAYRILQEALQNIRKYSNARNIFVTLSKIDNELKLVIYDDGIGFNPDKKRKGIGIKNIFTRVNSLNGTIKLLTQPGQGVAYNISLPLSKN